MALTDINAVDSKVFTGAYSSQWFSLTNNADLLEPQVYQQMFKAYGKNAKLIQLLDVFGRTIDIPDANIKTIERTWPQRFIKTAAAINAGAAGASITVQLDSSCKDANGNVRWMVGDVILVPAKYLASESSRGYRIASLSQTAFANDTATCYPLSNGSTLSKSQVTTQIPVGTYMAITYNAFARGTGQPSGTTDSYTTREHTSFLTKKSVEFEGNIFARPYREITNLAGTGKFLSEKLVELEFQAEESQALALLTGEPNENTSIVQASHFGGANNAVASGMGLYQWVDALGLKHTYSDKPSFSDFYTVGQLFASQDITGVVVDWFTGYLFDQYLEEAGLSWTKEFSSGTDLYDKAQKRLGIIIKAVTLGSLTHVFHTLPEMSKAGGLGIMSSGQTVYEFPEMAIGIPRENVTYEQFGNEGSRSVPNLVLAYVNANGENNRKVLKRLAGVSGAVDNLDVASEYHGVKWFLLSQFALIGGEFNKFMLMRKEKSV